MPVTFGTVRVVPPANQPAPTPTAGAGAASGEKGAALDPRDLTRALRGLHLRNLRVRAY